MGVGWWGLGLGWGWGLGVVDGGLEEIKYYLESEITTHLFGFNENLNRFR